MLNMISTRQFSDNDIWLYYHWLQWYNLHVIEHNPHLTQCVHNSNKELYQLFAAVFSWNIRGSGFKATNKNHTLLINEESIFVEFFFANWSSKDKTRQRIFFSKELQRLGYMFQLNSIPWQLLQLPLFMDFVRFFKPGLYISLTDMT